MSYPYTPNCNSECELVLETVPGAQTWPRRLICKIHGYPGERTNPTLTPNPETEPPNDYVQEIASPADVYEVGGKEVSQY